MIRGLRRRDSNPERLGIVERLSFRKKAIRGPASPLPPRPPTMGGRGSNTGGRSNSLGHSGGLQIEERSKGGTLTKGGRQAQGENYFTTHPQSASHSFTSISSLFHHYYLYHHKSWLARWLYAPSSFLICHTLFLCLSLVFIFLDAYYHLI